MMSSIRSVLETTLLKLLPLASARRHAARVNVPARSARTLFIDVSLISQRDAGTGIQRVVREIVSRLARTLPAAFARVVTISATPKGSYRHAEGVELAIDPGPGDIVLALDYAPRVLWHHWADLLRWKRNGASIHFVLYDMLPAQYPLWFTRASVRNHARWLRTIRVFADHIHCISETVREDFVQTISIGDSAPSPSRITTFPLGGDFHVKPPRATVSGDQDSARAIEFANRPRTALLVGTLEPRKAHLEVLATFDSLWAAGDAANLIIVGRPGWKGDEIEKRLRQDSGFEGKLVWISGPDDATLASIYRAVTGVIVPSFSEGLGLPVVEARYHGKPLLLRDIAVFREAAADARATFFSATGGLDASTLARWLDGCSAGPLRETSPPLWSESLAALLHNIDAGESLSRSQVESQAPSATELAA